mmetsp:Transcript_3802/g.6457  ORF Transcript_3802/g.6457 Transcript_3802/m.6457 type:complete len:122 (-) Transcript_3802:287-652(-)
MARVWARAAAVGVRLGEAYRSPTDGRRFKPFVFDGERHTVDSRSSWIGESFSDPMVEVMVEEVVFSDVGAVVELVDVQTLQSSEGAEVDMDSTRGSCLYVCVGGTLRGDIRLDINSSSLCC